MGQRGPLPKPTRVRELEGNTARRPLPTSEPTPAALPELPPPPPWMPPLAIATWRELIAQLHAVGMLHGLDLIALQCLCVAYAHWREMVRQLETVGHTKTFCDAEGNEKYAQATPEASQMGKYAAEVNRWAKVLGIGPAYRVGLGVAEQRSDVGGALLSLLGGAAMPAEVMNAVPTPKKPSTKPTAKKPTPKKTTTRGKETGKAASRKKPQA